MDDTQALLAERATTHGSYANTARTIQAIKDAMRSGPNWGSLTDIQKESLEMVANKIGRCLSGNPNVADHWDDIAGYAKLVSNDLTSIPDVRKAA